MICDVYSLRNNENVYDYVVEIYTDDFGTLFQSIIYPYGDDCYKNFLRNNMINPNLKHLIRKQYYKKTNKNISWPGELVKEEKYSIGSSMIPRTEYEKYII